jgi:hypothetical protein
MKQPYMSRRVHIIGFLPRLPVSFGDTRNERPVNINNGRFHAMIVQNDTPYIDTLRIDMLLIH